MDHCKAEKQAVCNEVSFRISSSTALCEDGQNLTQQQQRLSRHSVVTNMMSFLLLAALCSLDWSNPGLARHHVVLLVPATMGAMSFALATVPMAVTWKTKSQLTNARCCGAYASTLLLMSAPIGLLLQLDKAYASITVPLLPVCVCIFLLLRRGAEIGFSPNAAHYGPHDHDLRCLFHLAAGVTVPAYAGLLNHLVCQLRRSSMPREGVRPVECILLYSVVTGLTLMLLTASPPALYLRQTRTIVVNRFLGALADAQLGLVALAIFVAALEAAQGYAALVFTATAVAACAVFAREHEDEPDHRGEHDVKSHLISSSPPSITLLLVYLLTFGVLMVIYSTVAREHAGVSSYRKEAFIVMASSLLVSNLSLMALQRRAPRTESMLFTIAMFRRVHDVLLVAVVASGLATMVEESGRALASVKKFMVSLV